MTLAYPQWALVDAPSLDANVLVDFNPHGYKASGFSLGAPDFLGDADSISPELGFRSISGAVIIEGSDAEMAAWLSQAQRALMRPRAFMLWCPTPDSEPLWAHTYQSASGPLSWDLHRFKASDENRLVLPLTITADPGLLGEQEAFELTIGNDPSAGGCFAALPEIKGDLPAPLRLEFEPTETQFAPAIAVGGQPWFVQAEDYDDSSGTITPLSDADFSDGAGVETAAGQLIYNLTPPSAGEWAVFVRARAAASMSEFTVQLSTNPTVFPVVSAQTTATDEFVWVRAGWVSAPNGPTPSGPYTFGPGAVQLLLYVEQIQVDCIAMLPAWSASAGTCLLTLRATAEDIVTVDSAQLAAYRTDPDSVVTASTGVPGLGCFPSVVPGRGSYLSVLRVVRDYWQPDHADELTAETTVTCSYLPRYLGLPS